MSKANKGTKRRRRDLSPKKHRKAREMDQGEVREAEAKGHRFYPERHCPKCQTRAHERDAARSLR